mmetsp:Transcript_15345/g.36232  ORF Transcript_15345/g.36232 Transcript_15345/m.36232 type:complete len:268 (-) Transcript_15345:1302-2105(-)
MGKSSALGIEFSLVDLDRAVNEAVEEVASHERDKAAQHADSHHDDQGVPRKNDARKKASQTREVHVPCVVVQRIHPEVDRHAAACEPAAPPPSVVLGAQLQVAQHHRHLRHRDNQDGKHQKQEPKHVVKPMLPYGPQNDSELDKDDTEGQDAGEQQGGQGLEVPRLRRDLAGNGICAAGERARLLAIAQETAEKHEGKGDAKPEQHECNHGSKRNGAGRTLGPHEKVDEDEQGKDHSRNEQRGHEGYAKLVAVLEQLGKSRGHITGN